MKIFRHTSLSTKLSITTSIVATMLIMGIAVYAYMLKSNEVIVSRVRDINLSLTNTSLSINRVLAKVEAAMHSNTWQIDKCVTINEPDSVGEVLSQLLALDDKIVCSGVIFDIDDDQTPTKPYMIYATRDSAVTKKAIPSMVNDPRNISYAWLRRPFTTHTPDWSTPHADLVNGKEEVCSYILPVSNRNNDQVVLFFADIPTKNIRDVISYDMPVFLLESFLVDDDGRCISYVENNHKEDRKQAALSEVEIKEAISAVGDSIKEGDHGSFDLLIKGQQKPTYYNVVNASHWILYYVVDFSLFSSSLLESTRMLILIFILSLICLHLVLSYVIKRMTRPLRQFSDSALEISKGNFNAKLPEVNTNDEMALLHDSFDTMQRSLTQYTQRIKESSQREAYIKGELNIASRIQNDLLPKEFPPFPERDDIDVCATLIPATQIGGDLYNYFIRDSKLFFIIGDVSGKSVPAAMVMAMASTVFKTVASMISDPLMIMHELNTITCSNNENSGFFITAIVGVLNLTTGELKLCNAGHDPLIKIGPQGKAEVLRLSPNLPVGVVSGYEYKDFTMQMEPESRLILYTDGITETENDNEFYGIQRLTECIGKGPMVALPKLIDNVVGDVKKFSGQKEQDDDLTIMAISYHPSEVLLPEMLCLDNEIDDISQIMHFSDAIGERIGLSKEISYKINLVIEEAVTNIINYSKAKGIKQSTTLFASVHGKTLSIIISDTGKKFDPTLTPNADTNAPLEARQIGGLGITLMRHFSTNMSYRRLHGRNYLTLKFNL